MDADAVDRLAHRVAARLAAPAGRRGLLGRLAAAPVAAALAAFFGAAGGAAAGEGAGAGGSGNGAIVGGGGRRRRNRGKDPERKRRRKRSGGRCVALGRPCGAGRPRCCQEGRRRAVCTEPRYPQLVPRTCQDCRRPPDPARALCQEPPGDQCCGGNPRCFVAVRPNGVPICVEDFACRPQACSEDYSEGCNASTCCDDPDFPLCVAVAPGSACCGATTATACAAPCPAA